jgi:hypothetical protein
MLKIEKLRYLIHTVTVLIDAAVKNEVERSQLSLALIFSFISMRSVGRSIGCSHQTAARVTNRLLELKLPLPNFDDMTKDELYLIFYPDYK